MVYRLLGRFEVVRDGAPVDIGPRQQRQLLALLLVNANRVVPTERILEALWGDEGFGKEKTLWVYISRLRSALEPHRAPNAKSSVIITRDHGYSLVADPIDIDAHRFEGAVEEGRRMVRDSPEAAADVLGGALALWRGDPLEDFTYDDFAQPTIGRLRELHLEARESRFDADMRCGRHREVIGELTALVEEHPLREHPVGLLMIALYRSGRQSEALRAFGRYRIAIGDELGIEPSSELQRIEEQVLLHDPRLAGRPAAAVHASPGEARNPFKGLHAFSEADVDTFFGRDRLIAELVRRLGDGRRLVALVGASGSGKSSAIHAGLIPTLRKGALSGSDGWLVAHMVPGARPLVELEAALLRSVLDGPDSLGEQLSDPEEGLLRAALRLLPGDAGRLLLVIDQFEELFALVDSDADRARFIRNLEVALEDPHQRVMVVLALRADYYPRVLDHPRFAESMSEGVVNTVHLTLDELEAAAEEPAAVAGVHLEPALLARLLRDVAGQSGGLPLFQYALTELFDRRTDGLLTAAAYEELGGVRGALSRRAEELFQALDPDERTAAQQLFLRLVTIPESGSWSRRRVPGSQIVTISDDVVALQTVLDRFAAHRLLTFDRDRATGSPTVEVAHEALLHEWPRLREWIEQGRDDVLRHARFTNALEEWRASGNKSDYLLTGDRLSDHEQWVQVSTLRLSADEQRYLHSSVRHREELLEAEEARAARESRLDRKARGRLRGLVVAAVVLLAVTAGIAWVIFGPRPPQIAVVHGALGDLGVSDLMAAGLGTAEREFELEIEPVESLVDAEADLRHLAETGADLVVVSGQFDVAVGTVAPDYPDTHFVAIDPVALHLELENISEIHFAVEDSAYLAGAAAGMTTNTGIVGFIGAMQMNSERSRSGFEQGVAARPGDVRVLSRYVGPVENPRALAPTRDDLAYELARDLYAAGADVIFHDAGEAGAGVLRAATDLSTPDRPLWVIGSDVDEYQATSSAIDRARILSSSVKRYDTAVVFAVDRFLAGSLSPGEMLIGLPDEGVALSRSGGHLAGVNGQLANLDGEISLGHLVVASNSVSAPGWQRSADVVVRLSMSDRTCTYEVSGAVPTDGRLRVPRGAVVHFELSNDTPGVGGLSVRTIPPGRTLAELRSEASAGIPSSYEAILGISFVEPGASTSSAAVMAGSPIVPNCILPTLPGVANDVPALILSPSA